MFLLLYSKSLTPPDYLLQFQDLYKYPEKQIQDQDFWMTNVRNYTVHSTTVTHKQASYFI